MTRAAIIRFAKSCAVNAGLLTATTYGIAAVGGDPAPIEWVWIPVLCGVAVALAWQVLDPILDRRVKSRA